MAKSAFILLLLIAGSCEASYKPILNPITGQFDYVTVLSSTTEIPAASIQIGDANGCLWDETVNTSGAWVASLISCPAGPATYRPCTTGMSLGLLAAITCK